MTEDPYEMKRLGDSIEMTPAEMKSWDNKKSDIMKMALLAKFNQNPITKQAILDTGDKHLLEASTDRYWGCGKTLRDPEILTFKLPAKAKNTQGRLLEAVRKELSKK